MLALQCTSTFWGQDYSLNMNVSPNLSICESFCTGLQTFLWWILNLYVDWRQLCQFWASLHASTVVATTVGLAIAVEARAIVVDGLLPVYWGLRCGHCPVYGTTRWCSRTWAVCKALCTANPLLLLLKLQAQLKCTFHSVDSACSPDWE